MVNFSPKSTVFLDGGFGFSLLREKLKSTVLKVDYHSSNTSSTEEFINCVMPQISLIGVRQDNYIEKIYEVEKLDIIT